MRIKPAVPGRRSTDEGASSVEYGLLVAFIAAVIMIAVISFGGAVRETFTHTCERVQEPQGGTQSCAGQ